jgi:hypothetical protein
MVPVCIDAKPIDHSWLFVTPWGQVTLEGTAILPGANYYYCNIEKILGAVGAFVGVHVFHIAPPDVARINVATCLTP